MISENRLDEIALLPSRRENTESNDVEANYLVGRDMAGAIHELLEERHEMLLQVERLKEQADAKNDLRAALAKSDLQNNDLKSVLADVLKKYQTEDNADAVLCTRIWRLINGCIEKQVKDWGGPSKPLCGVCNGADRPACAGPSGCYCGCHSRSA
jgi:chorismate mutase